jgi:hypothetical protein
MADSPNTVTINGKEYEISPLLMKHLRGISDMVGKDFSGDVFVALNRWREYITFSIQVKTPDFNPEELDNMTMNDYIALWVKVQNISGIKLSAKQGETQPSTATAQTGRASTDVSAPVSAGVTVQ